MSATITCLSIPESAWEHVMADGIPSINCLHADIVINGHPFHADAYRVRYVRNTWIPADGDFKVELDHICSILGTGMPQPLEINGYYYVVVILPHAQ